MKLIHAALLGVIVLTSCNVVPDSAAEREERKTSAASALEIFKSKDSKLAEELAGAPGFAVFPEVGKAAIGIGGSYGSGIVYEGGSQIAFTQLSKGSIGFQLGGQEFRQLIIFEDQDSLNAFKRGQFEFAADVSAVILTEGAAGSADYEHGVKVLVDVVGGAMYEASLGGAKFSYEPF